MAASKEMEQQDNFLFCYHRGPKNECRQCTVRTNNGLQRSREKYFVAFQCADIKRLQESHTQQEEIDLFLTSKLLLRMNAVLTKVYRLY